MVIEALEKPGLKNKVKVMIGGVPVTRAYADEIGAEGFAEDCTSAIGEATRLMALVEKEQVKAIVEVKSYIHTRTLFGGKSGDSRDSKSGLAYAFEQRGSFLSSGARYILFTF